MFKISDHIDFDDKGRAVCPFCSEQGKNSKNLSLIPNTDGAYKCFRGCTPEQIREAIGQSKDLQVPAALAKPSAPGPNVLVPTQKVIEACDRLLNSKEPLEWLQHRGISLTMVRHYRLGLVRSLCGQRHLNSISIPFPDDGDGNQFYQKKRIAPWLSKDGQPEGYKNWNQYGIPAKVWFTHQPDQPKQTWIVAGEWDAMMLGWAMREQSDIAICTFTAGEGNIPKDKTDLDKLKGDLITFYDLDDAGIAGAQKVQTTFGDRCRIATVPAPPDPMEGFDVSDSLNSGFKVADFLKAAQQAVSATPAQKQNPLASRIITNRELIDRAPDFVDFLVPDLLTEDELFVIAGPPRGGKSLLCMSLTKAIATGGRFLDRPVTQGSVLYINCEDSEAKVKQRQIAQEWDADLPVYWMNRFKLSELGSLIEFAKTIPDLRLIVLDTLSRVRDDNHNESSAELSRVLEPLQEMAQEQKICVIITHHTSKMTAEELLDPFNSIRGSGAIRATCRGAIVLAPGDNCYRLISENGHSEKLDIKIRVDPNTWEWKSIGRWMPRIPSESIKDQVLDHISFVGEATIPEIAAELQINANTVKVTLWRLLADDMVSKKVRKRGDIAVFYRSDRRLHVTSIVTPSNPCPQSDVESRLQKNILINSGLKVIKDPKVINPLITFKENDHFLADDHPFSPFVTSTSNVDAASDTGEKIEVTCNLILPGLKVIILAGRFYGMPAEVLTIDSEGQVEVRAKGWQISRTYPPDQLRLIAPEEDES